MQKLVVESFRRRSRLNAQANRRLSEVTCCLLLLICPLNSLPSLVESAGMFYYNIIGHKHVGTENYGKDEE